MDADGDLWQAALATLRPLEPLSPSAWSERYRVVKGGPHPGQWRNETAPYLTAVMDAVEEAIEQGKLGVCLMKSAQGGGTEALGINAVAWLLTYLPGPYLYLTARDETAEEVSRDRWAHVLDSCAPLRAKHLAGKRHGEKIRVKRLTDGKLMLSGARSPNNFISNPYRGVIFDELDSIAAELPDGADPIATLTRRLTAFAEGGSTTMIAYAHPTTRERGIARLWYEESDQRRAHVQCPHCGKWVAPAWDHVRVLPAEGEAPILAERDARRYHYVAPCCGAIWSEPDRLRAIREVRQISTLLPEAARQKRWIGLHFWSFLMRSQSVEVLARERVDAANTPSKLLVFRNKIEGDVDLAAVEADTTESWAATIAPAGGHVRGRCPAWVQFLTAGQDSRLDELHWAVWGWGYRRGEGPDPVLCGVLVDYGVEPGPRKHDASRTTLSAEDLHALDDPVYGARWPTEDGRKLGVWIGLHDAGWMPLAVYGYCADLLRRGIQNARPSKGYAEDDRSRAKPLRWTPLREGDPVLRADLNVYVLKTDLAGFREQEVGDSRRLLLPCDVSSEMVEHLASEKLAIERGRRYWKRDHTRKNHWLDCLTYAYAAASEIAPGLAGRTLEDQRKTAAAVVEARRKAPPPEHPIRTRY